MKALPILFTPQLEVVYFILIIQPNSIIGQLIGINRLCNCNLEELQPLVGLINHL